MSSLNESVHIPRPAELAAKVARLLEGGFDDLAVVADFDRTITSYSAHGRRGSSAHGVMEKFGVFTDEYKKAAGELTAHYLPIETAHDMTIAEKLPHMKSWYKQSHALILTQALTLDMIPLAVSKANVELREGFVEMIRTLEAHEVPVLVFSAGLADILVEVRERVCGRGWGGRRVGRVG